MKQQVRGQLNAQNKGSSEPASLCPRVALWLVVIRPWQSLGPYQKGDLLELRAEFTVTISLNGGKG